MLTEQASKDDAGIEIDIEKTDDAEGYYIYLQKESDASPVLYSTIDKDGSVKRSCSLKNLAPGKYTVSIKAYRKEKGDVITSEFGEPVKLKLSGFGEMDYSARFFL